MIKHELRLTNTLGNKNEFFIPITGNTVKMYVCGITPYDKTHIGHGRVYVTFDLILRLLKFLDYNVVYCRNFTDIDDKLLAQAKAELGDKFLYKKIADRYIKTFNEDMKSLNCLPPTYEPKVTQTISSIIDFIGALIDKGYAYVSAGNVYYEVRKFSDYGKLSKRKLEDLKSGARIEIDERKKDPLDFALWKKEQEGTFWESSWGWGRPGWHIECSAMAEKYLGKYLDIHGGGMDLIFPHHENEIAQSEALFGPSFSKYWVHNAFVRINKQKMSKSLNNFFTLDDIFKKFDPMVVRFYYINHNYTIPIDFSIEELERAQKNYQKLCKIFEAVSTENVTSWQIKRSDLINSKLMPFLCDDLNTAGMFGALYENLSLFSKYPEELSILKAFLQQVLGLELKLLSEKKIIITDEIQKMIQQREEARKIKDWKKADELREKLKELGYEVQDKAIKS